MEVWSTVNSVSPKRHWLVNENLSVKCEIPLSDILVVEASEAPKTLWDIEMAHYNYMMAPCYLKTPLTFGVGDEEINLN